MAALPQPADDAILRFRRAMADQAGPRGRGAAILVGKELPVDASTVVSPPTYTRHDDALSEVRRAANAALFKAGVLEARAACTGALEDVEAYFEALSGVDAALTSLWGVEAVGAIVKRADLRAALDALRAREAEIAASMPALMKKRQAEKAVEVAMELRAAHAELVATRPLPDAAIQRVLLPPTFSDRAAMNRREEVAKLTARVARKVKRQRREKRGA